MAWFAEVMAVMAPDVIVVPVIRIGPDQQPEEICRRLRPVAEEYAARVEWGLAP